MLVILAVEGAIETGIGLFSSVMERNRDNYVLLCLHNAERLDAVLSRCMRPAGILLAPFREEAMRMSLDRALRDYTALYEQEGQNGYMTLTSGKTLRRIAYRDIQYLEAQDKLLNILHQALCRFGAGQPERGGKGIAARIHPVPPLVHCEPFAH